MSQEIASTHQLTLEEVREHFEEWRRTRKKREPISAQLWEAAESLTKKYTLHEITKTLRLNYQKFNERVQRKEEGKDDSHLTRAQFLQLTLSNPQSAVECVIEIEDLKGRRMKMSLKGETGGDMLEWAKQMWERPL